MEEVYWYVAIISTGLVGLIILMNILGFDLDDMDLDIDADFFSFNSLIGFFCVGGWIGYLGSSSTDYDQWLLLSISILFGLMTYVGSILILRRMKNWESSGNIELKNAIGNVGKVYLTIPAKEDGEGQVEVLVQGRLKILRAITPKESIPTGEKVLVYDVRENKLVVTLYTED